MQDDTLTRLLQRFAAAATAHYQALEAMDEQRATKQAGMVAGLYRSIIGCGECGRQALLALVDDKDPVVAGMAAVYSVRYSSERCLAALQRIAGEPGLLGFRAQLALERWQSGGWPVEEQ
jgi:hypothetical protein